jgi:hypothetical protein
MADPAIDSARDFFFSTMTAGAIVAGFCGTFLSFRIQREAQFFRTPEKSHGIQHFTSSFMLILLATLVAMLVGVVMPVLYLAGFRPTWINPRAAAGGYLAAMVLVVGYFANELLHYRLVFRDQLGANAQDAEWRRESIVWVPALVLAAIAYALGRWWL